MHSLFLSVPQATTAFILDALFPKYCVVCRKIGNFLCKSCEQKLPRRVEHVCAHCSAYPTPNGNTCFNCREKTPLDGIFSAGRYQSSELADTIHRFKYNFLDELAVPLGRFLASSILRSDLAIPDIILPVPLHPRRERWRGWNQSLLLARELVRAFPEDIAPKLHTDILIRTRFTSPQMSIGKRSNRESNVLDAFDRRAPQNRKSFASSQTKRNAQDAITTTASDITGKTFWIIDDVAASGSTLRECAKVLKLHGAREVRGVVIAR